MTRTCGCHCIHRFGGQRLKHTRNAAIRHDQVMRLTPTERDRLLLFSAAELARARRARGLTLNVPEATALVADTVAEAARDGARLADAVEAGKTVLGHQDVLPGVADVVTEVWVEAVFDDGSRLVVVPDPIGGESLDDAAPGALQHDGKNVASTAAATAVTALQGPWLLVPAARGPTG